MFSNVEAMPYTAEAALRYSATKELRFWLESLKPTHFITFNFNTDVTLISARRALKRFHAKLDRALHGRRFHLLSSEERTFFVAFPEHVNSNLHYHALLRTNSYDFSLMAPKIWKQVVPSGDLHNATDDVSGTTLIEAWADGLAPAPMRCSDVQTVADYVTKDAFQHYEHFVISTEFAPHSA